MKRLHAHLLPLLLALTLLLLCACAEGAGDASSSAGGTPSDDTVSSSGDIAPKVIDLKGREINVLCWNFSLNSNSILGYTGEIIPIKPGTKKGLLSARHPFWFG